MSDSPFLSPARKVAIYIRVSTSEQKVEGYGLEAQERRLLQYVEERKSSKLVTRKEWVFCDVHTGSDINRPSLQKMLKMVRKGRFDAVLVWKIDRLSRSLKHLLSIFEEFEHHQVSFLSMQENIDFTGPIGKLIFQIFGAIAQFERELIKGRTKMGKIASAEMGNYTGSAIPYGYKPIPNPKGKGKKLTVVEDEKKWVQEIYHWHVYEDMGFGQIANRLNEMNVPKGKHVMKKSRHTPWNQKTVRDILTNPIYRGEFVANKTDESGGLLPEDQWTIVAIPKCISELMFQQAVTARKHRNGGLKSTHYLLSGKLVDMTLEKPKAFCGCKRSGGGFSYRRKPFKDRTGLHHPSFEVPGKQLEEYVWDKIVAAMKNPEVFIEHYLAREYTNPSKAKGLEQQLDTLRESLSRIQAIDIPRIESAYERGLYDEDKLQERLTAKNQEIATIEEKISDLEGQLHLITSATTEAEKLREASAQIKYKLEQLDRAQKKVLCHLFIERIEMFRTRENDQKAWTVRAEIYFRFNPDRVPTEITKVRTSKQLEKANEALSEPKNGQGGDTGHDGYNLFRFAVRLKSNGNRVWLEGLTDRF